MDNEQVLIEQAQNGEVDAFEQLISSYQDKVYDIAYRLTGNKNDADDLFQETFIHIFNSIKNYKGNSAFFTWIYRITHNVFLDSCKKAHKKHEMLESDAEETPEDGYSALQGAVAPDDEPHKKTEETLFKEKIHKTIQLLPEDYRMPIVLYDIEGFTYEEIAEIVNIPIGTVRSRINRARQQLREVMIQNKTFPK